jgi:hypothetical protein
MIKITTTSKKIPASQLRDGDWAIADFGDQLILLRYQDSLVQGDYRPIVVDTPLLNLLGFQLIEEQPDGNEAEIYMFQGAGISVINEQEFIFEGGAKGRIAVHELHLLQQTWRQLTGEELVTDFLEQPHTIEVAEE